MIKKTLCIALLAFLAACSSEPRPEPLALDYTNLGKITLNTSDLRIINRAQNVPQWPPYVGHKYQPKLTDAVYKLAGDRLQAGGELGHATLIIKDATITEQGLQMETGFDSMFTRQQGTKLIGRVEVSLEAQSPTDGSIAITTAKAVYSVTLPEDPADFERQDAYNRLVSGLMGDLNTQLERGINEHLSRFIVTGSARGEERVTPTSDSALRPAN